MSDYFTVPERLQDLPASDVVSIILLNTRQKICGCFLDVSPSHQRVLNFPMIILILKENDARSMKKFRPILTELQL
jgi:hypothetical protein